MDDLDTANLRKAFDELPSGDLSLIEALLDEDVLWSADEATEGRQAESHGRAAAMAMVKSKLGALPDLELGEVRQARDGVVLEFKSKSFPSGHTFRLLTMKDGKVLQMKVFETEDRALGAPNQPTIIAGSDRVGQGIGEWDDTGTTDDRDSTINHPGDGGPG
jgi:ketosteroid isomerase-like protein